MDARAAMKNLAMSEVMAGANFWDAPGHSMAGSNDAATRKQIFDWIAKNEKTLYNPRVPMNPWACIFPPRVATMMQKSTCPPIEERCCC